MLLREAKELLKRNGYRLVEDTDDWDEADLGIDSYADRKNVMKTHNKGKNAGWHFRDLHTKTNHASYAAGNAGEDKILDAFRAEFDEVSIKDFREWGTKGKIIHNGIKCSFKLSSCYRFVSPADKDKVTPFKTHSNKIELILDDGAMYAVIDATKQKEIVAAVDEVLDYISNKAYSRSK